ncbi:MAG: hypothetical protein BWY63_02184 [Chloroflexi bacterium ADurb.Bin360]|nr:MAG: hypothetical protein BWY63_02184 [Chloroflexi bacterium ADurb.Bin360]
MKRKLILALMLCLVSSVASAQGGTVIDRWVIGGGGGTAAGANVVLHGILGQPLVGLSSEANIQLCSGFLCQHFSVSRVFLPLTLNQFRYCDPFEPNDDRRTNPWGPLLSGQTYSAKLCDGDPEDNYYFDVTATGALQVRLQLPSKFVGKTALWVYKPGDFVNPLCGTAPVATGDYILSCSLTQAGRYIVRLYAVGTFDNSNSYHLRVTFPN